MEGGRGQGKMGWGGLVVSLFPLSLNIPATGRECHRDSVVGWLASQRHFSVAQELIY